MSYEMMFCPMKIGQVEIKNRIVMEPMEVDMGDWSGFPTKRLTEYYEERAKGGVGLIITAITRVNDVHGATTFCQLSVSRDKCIQPLSEFAKTIQKHGTKVFVQLHHPGRQNVGAMVGMMPILIPFEKCKTIKKMTYKIAPKFVTLMKKGIYLRAVAPSVCERAKDVNTRMRELSNKEVKKLVQQFVDGAIRCKKAGVDGVELHSAHGYLIQQFLSPHTNLRTDEYGGSLENRMRFLTEIISGIKSSCGKEFPVIVRLSVDECYEFIGRKDVGYNLKEGVEIAKRLEQLGIDAIDVSVGGYDTYNYWLEPMSFQCGWRKNVIKAVKESVKIPVIAVNLIRSPKQAESQLQEGLQDFIGLARPLFADPQWANKCKNGDEKNINRCISCLYCMESMQHNAYIGKPAMCALNPKNGHEKEFETLEKVGNDKIVAVVGGGVGGLSTARTLKQRGFKPIVFEEKAQLGGQINLAKNESQKEKISWCVEDLVENLKSLDVELRLNEKVTKEKIQELSPYAVVIATGGDVVKPKSIDGIDLPNVFTTSEILSGEIKLEKQKITLIGSGMTGLETAIFLCEQGNSVAIVEMQDEIAKGTWFQHIDDALSRLQGKDVQFYTNKKLVKIKVDGIEIQDVKSNAKISISCDSVVLAMGVASDKVLYNQIKDEFKNVYIIGDAKQSGRIADAVHDGFNVAMAIK